VFWEVISIISHVNESVCDKNTHCHCKKKQLEAHLS
jgi:hypothetical protein